MVKAKFELEAVANSGLFVVKLTRSVDRLEFDEFDIYT